MNSSEELKFEVSTEKSKMDIALIHSFLSKTYWARGRTPEVVKKTIMNSFCFGIYAGERQIGFARVITDFTIFAYLADVFIIEEFRGKGAARKLLGEIFGHRQLKGIKKWMLATSDAHGLYKKFGFKPLKQPEKYLELITLNEKK